jgi:hypothetical protein
LAQIAELTKQADAIKDGIKNDASLTGDKVFEGEALQGHLHRDQPLCG